MGTRLHRPVDDPATISSSEDERTVAFRRARDELNNKIEAWLAEQVDRRDPRAQRSEQGV